MGISLLTGMSDKKSFEDAVAHELHHVGFHFWSTQDAVRQSILDEQSGRTVAVLHIQNLLSEGMANYYCTPEYVFRELSEVQPIDPFQARLLRFQKDENKLFA